MVIVGKMMVVDVLSLVTVVIVGMVIVVAPWCWGGGVRGRDSGDGDGRVGSHGDNGVSGGHGRGWRL